MPLFLSHICDCNLIAPIQIFCILFGKMIQILDKRGLTLLHQTRNIVGQINSRNYYIRCVNFCWCSINTGKFIFIPIIGENTILLDIPG